MDNLISDLEDKMQKTILSLNNEFNKIIETKDIEKKITSDQKKKIKIIDYGKLKESEKKIKNKLGIEKIKVVYFD